MKICFFGMYASRYSRNRILIKGFKQNGVEIIECNDRGHLLWGLRYFKLLWKFIDLNGWTCDIIFVGFPGQTDVPLAWVLGKVFHKKVIFDAFISLYNSMVFDRKYFRQDSWRAKFWWFIDWMSCKLADHIILDTNEHIKYFSRTFTIPRGKFSRVFVGTDTDIFYPRNPRIHKGFQVGFHGSFLPLQGVDTIVEAAKILSNQKDIFFNLLGDGLERKKVESLIEKYELSNLKLYNPIPYTRLPAYISSNDIYLGGPFGLNTKSKMVIPNKVYESIACRKPVIVGDTMALHELFENNVHCLFVRQGDPKRLAQAILELKSNYLLREKISSGGYNLIVNKLSAKKLCSNLLEYFRKYELNI